MVATGNAFALGAFETAVQRDAEVLGVLYTGSLGRGTADRYSDLDIELWVTDRAFADAPNVLRRLMGHLGTVQFMYEREAEARITGFVGPDWQRVDLALHRQTETELTASYATARIVKDVDGSLARSVAQVPQETIAASWEQARAVIAGAIDSQIYLSLHNARGAVWSAMGEISYSCSVLYTLLALLRGRRSFGFRYVEQLLSPKEKEMLCDAWPREPDREEVRRAARALWGWTRHVWHQGEITLGRSLELRIDEAELLAAVERIYSSPTQSNRAPDRYHD
jgi:hypothetical protein